MGVTVRHRRIVSFFELPSILLMVWVRAAIIVVCGCCVVNHKKYTWGSRRDMSQAPAAALLQCCPRPAAATAVCDQDTRGKPQCQKEGRQLMYYLGELGDMLAT